MVLPFLFIFILRHILSDVLNLLAAAIYARIDVSIPKRVTAKVELLGGLLIVFVGVLFQSLRGLQPKWNPP